MIGATALQKEAGRRKVKLSPPSGEQSRSVFEGKSKGHPSLLCTHPNCKAAEVEVCSGEMRHESQLKQDRTHVNEREKGVRVKLRVEIVKVEEFKYLSSTIQNNRRCTREVKKRVQTGWSGWRQAPFVTEQ